MSLISIFSPQTATELDALVAVLEASQVPCFVRETAGGSRSQGSRFAQRSIRTIMVPAECVTAALELIGRFKSSGS